MRVRGGRPRRRARRAREAQAVPRAQPVDGARPRRFRAAARAAARFHALRGFPSSRVLGLLQRVAVDGGRPGLRLDGRRVEAHVDAAVGAGDDLHRRLPFWTRGRFGELLACLATPLPQREKRRRSCPFGAWRFLSCWRVLGRVVVFFGAKLRSFAAEKPRRSPRRCETCGGAVAHGAGAQLRPALPSALAAWRTGDASPGPSGATKKGRGVTPPPGQPQATTNGVAAETAPLLPAPRECERTARLHALRRAAAAARLGPPVFGTARDRLPPERDADATDSAFSPRRALDFLPTSAPPPLPPPSPLEAENAELTAAARRGRAQCRAR